MSKSVKIYYKPHNLLNVEETSDWDRSHMASFYAANCDIYTSANTFDTNNTNKSGKVNGQVFTFIDPSTCEAASPVKSSIGLLSTFACSYAIIDLGTPAPTSAALVTKVGVTPDTTLEMVAHGFISEATPVFSLPGGGHPGLHFVHFKLNSGQDFVYGHYEQLGTESAAQRFNILTAIGQMRDYANGVGAPFIFIVNSAYNPESLKRDIRTQFPTFSVYPPNRAITQCQLTDFVTLAIQNRNIIVTNGIDVDMNIIPPQTPVPYAFDEQNAIIVTLKNLKIGQGSSANATCVKDFNLQPRNVILQEF